MALVHFVGVVELAVVFRLPVLMVSCGMSIEIAHAEVWTTACLDCGGVDRPICRRGGMTDSGGKQSDHDKQCHSVHRSTPVRREYAPLGGMAQVVANASDGNIEFSLFRGVCLWHIR